MFCGNEKGKEYYNNEFETEKYKHNIDIHIINNLFGKILYQSLDFELQFNVFAAYMVTCYSI